MAALLKMLRRVSPVATVLLLVMLGAACARQAGDAVIAADAASPETSDSASEAAQTGSGAQGTAGRDPPEGEPEWTPNAIVERIVDGDTLVALIGGRSENVRLIGIDTPESVAPTRPVQCYGEEAALQLAGLLPAGEEITLLLDSEARDAYDRLLGYIVRSRDGLFVNLNLVADGFAAALNIAPNDSYAAAFAQAEAAAISAGRGLWGACGGPDVPLH